MNWILFALAYAAVGFIAQVVANLWDGPYEGESRGFVLFFFGIFWPVSLVVMTGIGLGGLYSKGPEVIASKVREKAEEFKESRKAKKREELAGSGAVSLSRHEGGEVSMYER